MIMITDDGRYEITRAQAEAATRAMQNKTILSIPELGIVINGSHIRELKPGGDKIDPSTPLLGNTSRPKMPQDGHRYTAVINELGNVTWRRN